MGGRLPHPNSSGHMSIFEEIKERLEIIEVAQRYGIAVNRQGKALCPFHNEKTPSFTLYPDTQSFYCFGCGASGDAIELTARLFGLTAIEAVKRLNDDFCLRLPLDKPPDKKQVCDWQEDNRIYEGFHQWEQASFRELRGLFLQFREEMRDPLALQNRERVEYLLDILMGDSFQDKIELYKSKEVERMVKHCQRQKRLSG